MVKLISMMKRKAGITREEYLRHWYNKHGPLVLKLVPGVRKYIQNHPLAVDVPGVKSDFDGITEIWFDDIESYQKYVSWRASKASAELLADVERFVDWNNSVTFVCEEKIIKGNL